MYKFDFKNEKYYITAKESYGPLFDFDYCKNYTVFPEQRNLKTTINFLTDNKFKDQFQRSIDHYLLKAGESSKKIADFTLDNSQAQS